MNSDDNTLIEIPQTNDFSDKKNQETPSNKTKKDKNWFSSLNKFFKENKPYILLFIAVLIIVFLFFSFQSNEGFKFTFREQGFLFASNYSDPLPLLSENSKNTSFILLVSLTKEQSQVNSLMTNYALLPFITVLAANKKDTMILVKVYSNNELIDCYTNYGDLKENKKISKNECLKLIDDQSIKHSTIEILFPDSKLRESLVEVNKSNILLRPKTFEELRIQSLVVLRLMFSNTDSVIKQANKLANYLT